MAQGSDGRCHLFYSRWPRVHGFSAWVTHSEIAHAVADDPLGPYQHREVVLAARGPNFWDGHCTHNPTILAQGGRYYLYYMGNRGDRQPTSGLNWSHRNAQRIGVAVADSLDGPWQRFDRPLIDVTPGFHDALTCSNPSVMVRPDGRIAMIYKAVGTRRPLPFGGPVVHVVATASHPTGPFTKHPDPVFTFPGADFPVEDPCVWRERERCWAVVKDMKGDFTHAGRSLALMTSDDGFAWHPAVHPRVSGLTVRWADGSLDLLHALERPQVWLRDGVPAVLFCAGSRTADGEPDGTFNVAIPLCPPS